MKLRTIYTEHDSILNVDYTMNRVNALSLSKYLKNNLKSKGIDYWKFNTSTHKDTKQGEYTDIFDKNFPKEIYEYQNFFLLHKDDEYILLDGFRRLLWYPAVDSDITVRVYEYSDLKDKQIISLMVDLNQFKFHGLGHYYDRGFALLLKTVFGLNINLFFKQFNAYLNSSEYRNSYSSGTDTNITSVRERILSDHFISDIKFIESVSQSNVMFDKFVAAFVYRYSTEGYKLDAEKFISAVNANPVLMGLIEKWRGIGTNNYAISHNVVNKILEMYENIFDSLAGKEVELSFAEKIEECKKIAADLKKDKSFTKLTASKKDYLMEMIMEKRREKNIPTIFKCVIYPNGKTEVLDYGLLTKYKIKYNGMRKSGINQYQEYIIDRKGEIMRIFHNSNRYGFGNKYVEVGTGRECHKIELFVNITKAEIEFADKNRKTVIPE